MAIKNTNVNVHWRLYSLNQGCAIVVFGPLGSSDISNLQLYAAVRLRRSFLRTFHVCRQFSFSLKGQCPDYAHARTSSVFSSKDNSTVILTRQDFHPDRTADRDLLFIFSSNILDFRISLSSYIKIWLAVRRLIATLSLAGPTCDPKISFYSL